MSGTSCQDCVVTFLDQLEEAEVRALGVLVEAGLVSSLRLAPLEPGARTWVFPESKAS